MATQQTPIPGNYYVNKTGQLIKVRYILYSDGDVSRVILEYLDGHRMSVELEEWSWLDLTRYSDWYLERESETGQEI